MSLDTIEVKLPSGKVALVRNYTTRKDDQASEKELYSGVTADADSQGNQKLQFPISNVMASEAVYVARLTESIDGDNNVSKLIEELRSTDYEVLDAEVQKVVEENSPKAKKATSV